MTSDGPSGVVIVGGGLAGFTTATALRDGGFAEPITIVESEPASYDRPPLSKSAFAAGLGIEAIAFADVERFRQLAIDTRFGRTAVSIDPDAGTVVLDDGTVLSAARIVLATGGVPRRPACEPSGTRLVSVLRTFADAQRIRALATPGSRAIVAGGGLVGAELTAQLRALGVGVTLVDRNEVPMIPAFGETLARHLHAMHAAHGVDVRIAALEAIEERGDVVVATLSDGSVVQADQLVAGLGITAASRLAEAAGLRVEDGIVVDREHRTSHPRVFAAGDAARFDGPGGLERREEHWEAAELAGRETAAAILGQPPLTRGARWFWSDRYGVHVEVVGRLVGGGAEIVRETGEHPTVFRVDGGLLVGAASVDDPMTVKAARRIIDQAIPVTPEQLADPSISLRSLLRPSR